ncbi:hypothetical protein PIB30_082966 [Stylosanthes scabra]|uniref:Uncharacterized protein n=1 Tax=Stylosanthes scabra TaxID=79078 RepID=A0ABU6TSW5_9FABA|nr:hypothetical protein [Stylosanthes scabra]
MVQTCNLYRAGARLSLSWSLRNGVARARHLGRATVPPKEIFLIKKGGRGRAMQRVRPSEPPDLKSLVEELFTMQMSACQSVTEVVENEYGIHSDAEYGIHCGAEDDAVAKGKVEEHADLVLAREVTRPPPKPPNPDSHTVALGEAST